MENLNQRRNLRKALVKDLKRTCTCPEEAFDFDQFVEGLSIEQLEIIFKLSNDQNIIYHEEIWQQHI